MKRERGVGSIRRRGVGWQIRYYVDGRYHEESVARLLKKPASKCTREDAETVLGLRLGPANPKPQRLGVGFTPFDSVVCAKLEQAGGPVPLIFSGYELETMFGSIVYAYFRLGRAQYVGRSAFGIGRPCAPAHHRLGRLIGGTRQNLDHLVIWPMASEADAAALETKLIAHLKPVLNVRLMDKTSAPENAVADSVVQVPESTNGVRHGE